MTRSFHAFFSSAALLVLLALPFEAAAQKNKEDSGCPQPDNKDAQKQYDKARELSKYEFNDRLGFVAKAIELEPEWADANMLMATMIIKKAKVDGHPTEYKAALPYLKAAVTACPQIGAEPYMLIGSQYFFDEQYSEAIPWLEKFIKFETDDPKKLGKDYEQKVLEAEDMIKWARFYVDIKGKPRPFDPKLVSGISTARSEYLAIITPDNSLAFYIRSTPVNQMDRVWASQETREVFTMSNRESNGQFNSGVMLPPPFNQQPNEGGPTLTIDNKHLYYTITKNGTEGPNTDLYTCDYLNGEWTEIRPLGERVNDPVWWDSQPTVSADGNIIYFASNRPGGQGGIDIWMTQKDASGEWGVPVNLGPTINTERDEKSPFIHSDSQTLYFSSQGHPGMGGYDIFYARQDEKGNWKTPINIGIPINTENDELGFFVSTDGQTAFFNTNNMLPGAAGGYDVYQFPLYKEARPEKVVLLKGELKTDKGEPLTGNVVVEVKNVETKKVTQAVVDTTSGNYMAAIKVEKQQDYVITVKKEETAFSSQLVSGKQEFPAVTTTVKPIEVKPLETGKAYTINDINFASNSAVILPESMAVLEAFAEYLKANPNIRIQIQGHTDNVGDDGQNLSLSSERAFAVFEVLTQKFGVPRSQIAGAKGFGETQPVADNVTEAGRAKNRRTEFVIVSK
ncbi:MAG: OmpA family protein [Bacteroidia bacterium]|jgi:outer membrane protein OmpA-like peptidoglycan-associated protein|nr:OmpA family protein [Bacteroidia bacterium]